MAQCKPSERYHCFTADEVARIRTLDRMGKSLKEIAYLTKIKYASVYYILRANPKMWREIK